MKKINFNFNTKIGMRNLKTALAVIIGLYLSDLLSLNTPIFTSIASISGMKSSFAESFNDFKIRMSTTIFGVVLGFLLSLIPVSHYMTPIVGGLGIIFIIYILVAFNLKDMVILSCIVYIASFVNPESQLIYGIERVIGTFLGLVVSLAVNYLLSTPDVNENFTVSAINSFYEARNILLNLIFTDNHDVSSFESSFENIKQHYKVLLEELHAPLHPDLDIENARRALKAFDDIHLRFLLLSSINAHPKLKPSVITRLEDKFHITLLQNGSLEGDINEMYNLHIKKILFNLENLRELLNINEI